MSDIIDINISPVIETVDLTIQPNLTTINVNTVTGGGGAVSSVNTQIGDVVLNQDDILDGTTYKQYSLTEKNKLAGIAAGAEVNVNADWNATTGDAQILNKPTIPSITNLVPYTGANANVDLGEFELKTGQVTLDTTPTGTAAVATTRWNDSSGLSETTLKGGNVILKNGIDLIARIVNKVTPNTTLTKANYQVVRISGAIGQRLSVELAQANTDNNSADTLGIVTETIATNQEGFIITMGQLEGINTTGSLQGETWADGDVLYLSPTTAGRVTNIKPTGATGHIVVLGYVEHAHITQGKIYVKIMNGWELDELHNVFIDTPLNNQALTYETSTSLWKNKTIDKTFVGLGNVDNTSDVNKPVSIAQSTAINAKVADSITDGVTTIAPSQNAVFDALALKFDSSSYNWMLSQGYGLLGSSIKGVNLTCPTFASLTATSLGTGVGRYLSYYLPQAATITGVKFFQPNQGVYTGNNYNGVGLYSYSGGTLTLVASTTNDTEFWKGTSATWITKPFSSTYSAAAGVYYLFALYNSSAQTTAPTILFNAYNANNFPTIDFTNSAKLGGTSNSGTTTLPTPTVATTSINAATAGSGLILLY